MSEGTVRLALERNVATVVFDRPAARNAMTWAMYEELAHIARRLAEMPDLRGVVFRGAGGKAFVAGTDIAQFQAFTSGADGVAYEASVEATIRLVEALPVPCLAVVDGPAVGGGLLLAAACDFRIATPRAEFGVPIARTLGNCISLRNLARLVDQFGLPRVQRMLYLAETICAEEARDTGFVIRIAEADALERVVEEVVATLVANAPVTLRVTKQALLRLRPQDGQPDDHDLVQACYGSADFREGVAAFVDKRKPRWSGH